MNNYIYDKNKYLLSINSVGNDLKNFDTLVSKLNNLII